jgi:hypothetical protein
MVFVFRPHLQAVRLHIVQVLGTEYGAGNQLEKCPRSHDLPLPAPMDGWIMDGFLDGRRVHVYFGGGTEASSRPGLDCRDEISTFPL